VDETGFQSTTNTGLGIHSKNRYHNRHLEVAKSTQHQPYRNFIMTTYPAITVNEVRTLSYFRAFVFGLTFRNIFASGHEPT
jgi:hypothetical protein